MLRKTRQSSTVRRVLEDSARPLTTIEVLNQAREQMPTLNVATVYRNIKILLDEGLLRRVDLPGNLPRYEFLQLSSALDQHFQCTLCQRVFKVNGYPGDLNHLAPSGFTVERHALALYGSCADCLRGRQLSGRPKVKDGKRPGHGLTDRRPS